MFVKAEDCLNEKTVNAMKDFSLIIYSMAKGNSPMQLMMRMAEISVLGISKVTSFMAQGLYGGRMEIDVKHSGFTTKWKAKVYTHGRTE